MLLKISLKLFQKQELKGQTYPMSITTEHYTDPRLKELDFPTCKFIGPGQALAFPRTSTLTKIVQTGPVKGNYVFSVIGRNYVALANVDEYTTVNSVSNLFDFFINSGDSLDNLRVNLVGGWRSCPKSVELGSKLQEKLSQYPFKRLHTKKMFPTKESDLSAGVEGMPQTETQPSGGSLNSRPIYFRRVFVNGESGITSYEKKPPCEYVNPRVRQSILIQPISLSLWLDQFGFAMPVTNNNILLNNFLREERQRNDDMRLEDEEEHNTFNENASFERNDGMRLEGEEEYNTFNETASFERNTDARSEEEHNTFNVNAGFERNDDTRLEGEEEHNAFNVNVGFATNDGIRSEHDEGHIVVNVNASFEKNDDDIRPEDVGVTIESDVEMIYVRNDSESESSPESSESDEDN